MAVYVMIRPRWLNMLNNKLQMVQLVVAYWRHMARQIIVNNGSGNDLLPDGANPFPDERLTYNVCTDFTGIAKAIN